MNIAELKAMVNDTRFLNAVESEIESIIYVDLPFEPNHYIVVKYKDGEPIIYIDDLRFDSFDEFREQVGDDDDVLNTVRKICFEVAAVSSHN